MEEEDRALARLDRQIEARHARDRAGRRARGNDKGFAGPARPVGKRQARNAAAGAADSGHFAGDEDHIRTGLQGAPEGGEQGHGVEPALAGQAQRPGGDAVGV